MRAFILGLVMASTAPAAAEVVAKAPSGFIVKSTATAAADPAKVYADLTAGVSQWWDPEHTWFGKGTGLSIEPRAGGCFCEIDGTRSVRHLTVVWAEPGKHLRMAGGLGPLQEMAVTGAMDFTLKPAEGGGTSITMSYRVAGFDPKGLDQLAPIVDIVLGHQLRRLADHSDGKPLKPLKF